MKYVNVKNVNGEVLRLGPDMWRVTDAAKRWFPREVF